MPHQFGCGAHLLHPDPLPEVPVEYDSIATRGSMPNCAAVRAELIAMSASCSAVGSGTIAQSP